MNHFILFLNFISLFSGISAFFSVMFIYIRVKRTAVLFYSLCLVSLFMMIFGLTIRHYLKMNSIIESEFLHLLYFCFAKGGLVSLILLIPFFINQFFNIKISSLKTAIFVLNGLVACVLAIFRYIDMDNEFIVLILDMQLLGVFIYMLVIGIINIKKVESILFKKTLIIFIIISILFIPAFTPLHYMAGTFFAFFYIILSIFSIVISFVFFNRMPFYLNFKITDSFMKHFNLTEREIEIIDLIIKGFNNNDIADKLFISSKTVKNHITNIYQKTNTKNRIQLFNIINTSRYN